MSCGATDNEYPRPRVSQVRCLLFDTTGDDLLARELARIKADPTNQLEERVDELTDQLDEVKVQLHQERGMNRWKVILIQVGTILEEEQQSKFRKTTKKYIVKVKDQNNPAKIVEEGEEGGEDTWGNPEVVKKKKGMIKKQAEKLEKRDQAIAKRDAKLLAERQKFTEAVMEYEKQQAEEEAELQAHIGALTAADEAHNHQVQELEKAKLQLEADNTAMHQKWFEKATLLVEKEKYADSRYPELITFEDELKAKLAALETMRLACCSVKLAISAPQSLIPSWSYRCCHSCGHSFPVFKSLLVLLALLKCVHSPSQVTLVLIPLLALLIKSLLDLVALLILPQRRI